MILIYKGKVANEWLVSSRYSLGTTLLTYAQSITFLYPSTTLFTHAQSTAFLIPVLLLSHMLNLSYGSRPPLKANRLVLVEMLMHTVKHMAD